MKTDTILTNLRSNGCRVTKAREALVRFSLGVKKPFTIKEAIEGLLQAGVTVNDSTVYREVEFLVEQEILNRVLLQSDVAHFESAFLDHHHHLVCINCDKVEDVDCVFGSAVSKLDEQAAAKGFEVTEHQIEFFGRCAGCR